MSDKLVYIEGTAYWKTAEGCFVKAETKNGKLVETKIVMRENADV